MVVWKRPSYQELAFLCQYPPLMLQIRVKYLGLEAAQVVTSAVAQCMGPE